MRKILTEKRRYSLAIWALGLGYYISYTPYSGLTKALSNGLLPGVGGPVKGTVILPISAIATVIGMFSFITFKGWWKYAGRREFFGYQVPFPRPLTFLSGVCLATIMATTTLAFSFAGLSIVLVLVLLRGGTLIIAPVVDRIVGRRVRWFSWTAMFVSLAAVLMALSDASSYTLTIAAVIDIAAYLAAYFFKLQFMSRLAKTNERTATLRYFVEEQMVASPLLVIVLVVLALIGAGDVMMGFRTGLTSFVTTPGAFYAVLVGLSYAALCICTTLIFLDRRENTFCMPMHCGSSMLSGFTATAILALLANLSGPSMAQNVSAGFLVVALGFLSPLHHLDRYFKKKKRARLFLFVCSGNTCRSPMAAAIANAEIANRLGISVGALETVNVRALSAGVSARVGAPLTPEAVEVLRSFDVPVQPHAARNLTPDLAGEAELIFCMTKAHRQAVVDMLPQFASKTYCLSAETDVDDPIGKGMAAYVECARQIRSFVQLRFNEIALT
jgi:protein-tyrosine-phosphatase